MATEVTAFFVASVPTVELVETAGTGFGRIGVRPPTAARILLKADSPWVHRDIYNVKIFLFKKRNWSISIMRYHDWVGATPKILKTHRRLHRQRSITPSQRIQ
jgi:hypothetical protein